MIYQIAICLKNLWLVNNPILIILFLRLHNTKLYVLVYVDDIIILGNHNGAIHKFKDYLDHYFHMNDLGNLKYFLGTEVARNAISIFLLQKKNMKDLISDCGLLGEKHATIHIEQNHHMALVEEDDLIYPTGYISLIG